MKTKCEICKRPEDSHRLYKCQDERCSNKGNVNCIRCVSVTGSGLSKVFTCSECKRKNSSRESSKKRDATPLYNLRKHFGVSQETMAMYIGIGRRQYQGWEKDQYPIQESSKLILFDMCRKYAKEFMADWLTDQAIDSLMPPLSHHGKLVLFQMEPTEDYTRKQIMDMSIEPENMELRTFNKLVRHGFVEKIDGSFKVVHAASKNWRKYMDLKDDSEEVDPC